MADEENTAAPAIIPAPTHFKSKVWKHFGFYKLPGKTERDMRKGVCKLCRGLVTYCGNTTNLQAHLARHHPTLKLATVNPEPPKPSSSGQQQQSIEDSLNKLPSGSEKAKRITRSIGQFIAKDLRPYSVVENEGFRNLLYNLEPRYVIPSRKTITEKTVPNLYNEVVSEVKLSLRGAKRVALTCDGWTSRATEGYVTVTSHHITEDWSLRSHVLQTRAMHDSHTGKNLADLLKDVATEWGINAKDTALVTDNAGNMIVCAELCGFLHIRCYAHTLNLAAQRALKLPAVATLLGRIRRVSSFFHRSTKAHHIFREKQKQLKLPDRLLETDVATRWNSAYEMVQRFLEQQQAVTAALLSNEIRQTEKEISTLSGTDIGNAEQLVQALKPFAVATKVMSDDNNPTLSVIAPLHAQLLQETQESIGDSPFVKHLKAVMHQDLEKRYTSELEKITLNLASALDPRFKVLPFLSESEKQDTFARIVVEAASMERHQVTNNL